MERCMYYIPQGTLLAVSTMFYGLMSVGQLNLPRGDDPRSMNMAEDMQCFLQANFLIHLICFFFSVSFFPYFDVYINCTAVI